MSQPIEERDGGVEFELYGKARVNLHHRHNTEASCAACFMVFLSAGQMAEFRRAEAAEAKVRTLEAERDLALNEARAAHAWADGLREQAAVVGDTIPRLTKEKEALEMLVAECGETLHEAGLNIPGWEDSVERTAAEIRKYFQPARAAAVDPDLPRHTEGGK